MLKRNGRPVSVVVEDTLSSYYGNYWVLVTSSTAYIDTYVVGFTTCATWDCFGPGSRPYADTLEFRLERVGPSLGQIPLTLPVRLLPEFRCKYSRPRSKRPPPSPLREREGAL